MKNIVFLLTALLIISCGTFNQKDEFLIYPEVLEKYPLPTIPEFVSTKGLTLDTRMLIEKDGSVGNVTLAYKSGSPSWDKAAVEALKKWKYSPVTFNGEPVRIWIRQLIRIEIADPVYRTLSLIVCNSLPEADSVYSDLKRGANFWELAQRYSAAPSAEKSGKLGSIDIQRYPVKIQKEILKLSQGDFTYPLEYGTKYVIFKRNNY